jgi:hypothetical protein
MALPCCVATSPGQYRRTLLIHRDPPGGGCVDHVRSGHDRGCRRRYEICEADRPKLRGRLVPASDESDPINAWLEVHLAPSTPAALKSMLLTVPAGAWFARGAAQLPVLMQNDFGFLEADWQKPPLRPGRPARWPGLGGRGSPNLPGLGALRNRWIALISSAWLSVPIRERVRPLPTQGEETFPASRRDVPPVTMPERTKLTRVQGRSGDSSERGHRFLPQLGWAGPTRMIPEYLSRHHLSLTTARLGRLAVR